MVPQLKQSLEVSLRGQTYKDQLISAVMARGLNAQSNPIGYANK